MAGTRLDQTPSDMLTLNLRKWRLSVMTVEGGLTVAEAAVAFGAVDAEDGEDDEAFD